MGYWLYTETKGQFSSPNVVISTAHKLARSQDLTDEKKYYFYITFMFNYLY